MASTLTLPSWVQELRHQQVIAIQAVLREFQSGNTVVMLDAPTGSGKTLIGEAVRQYLGARAIYLCNSIALQTQFAKDYNYAAVLMGRANYSTLDGPSRFPALNAGDCIKERTMVPACSNCDLTEDERVEMHCKWCHPVKACPYELSKREAILSDLVCTNTSYFLHEVNYVGTLKINRELIIIDEADTLEDVLLSFVEVSVTQKKAEEYGIAPPKKKTVEAAWVEWAQHAEQTLKHISIRGSSVRAIRERNSLNRLRRNLKRLNDESTGLQAGGWVYTGYDRGTITFKPIQVAPLAYDYLWRHGKRFLFMSATTISFDVVAHTLGMDL